MDTKTTISISEARKRIFDIAEDVQAPGIYFTLTEKGRPKAVMMSATEFESWQETTDILRENPKLPKIIAKVDKDIKAGNLKDYISLEDLLAQKGFTLDKKKSKVYAIPSRSRKKGKKTDR